MRNRKLERALYGPTLYEITFGILLSVMLGAALAIAFLIFKPAIVVQELPKLDERERGATYFVEGTADMIKGKQWMRKRQMLLEGTPGEISLTEDDLNVWFLSSTEHGQKELEKKALAAAEAAAKQAQAKPAAKTPTKPAPKSAAPAAPAAEAAPEQAPEEAPPEELITCKVINFRIRDGQMQVGLPSTVNTLGWQLPVVVQARGVFEKRNDMYVFVPEEFMLGSFPLHRFPKAVEYVMEKAMNHESLPAEFMAAWKKVKDVTLDGKTLKLSI